MRHERDRRIAERGDQRPEGLAVRGNGILIHYHERDGAPARLRRADPVRAWEVSRTNGVIASLAKGGAEKGPRPLVRHDEQHARR
jgi:hypothetical protein